MVSDELALEEEDEEEGGLRNEDVEGEERRVERCRW